VRYKEAWACPLRSPSPTIGDRENQKDRDFRQRAVAPFGLQKTTSIVMMLVVQMLFRSVVGSVAKNCIPGEPSQEADQ
jgi:hypothetical protein